MNTLLVLVFVLVQLELTQQMSMNLLFVLLAYFSPVKNPFLCITDRKTGRRFKENKGKHLCIIVKALHQSYNSIVMDVIFKKCKQLQNDTLLSLTATVFPRKGTQSGEIASVGAFAFCPQLAFPKSLCTLQTMYIIFNLPDRCYERIFISLAPTNQIELISISLLGCCSVQFGCQNDFFFKSVRTNKTATQTLNLFFLIKLSSFIIA